MGKSTVDNFLGFVLHRSSRRWRIYCANSKKRKKKNFGKGRSLQLPFRQLLFKKKKRKKMTLTERKDLSHPVMLPLLSTLVPLFVTLKDNRSYTQVFQGHWGFFCSPSPNRLPLFSELWAQSWTMDDDATWELQPTQKVAPTEAARTSRRGVVPCVRPETPTPVRFGSLRRGKFMPKKWVQLLEKLLAEL